MKHILIATLAATACLLGFASASIQNGPQQDIAATPTSYSISSTDDPLPEPACEELCQQLRDAKAAYQSALAAQTAAATAESDARAEAERLTGIADDANQALRDALQALQDAKATNDPAQIRAAQAAVDAATDAQLVAASEAAQAHNVLEQAVIALTNANALVQSTKAARDAAQQRVDDAGCDCDE